MSVGVTGPLSAGDNFPVPRSIRDVLLPQEAGDFDREFRAAMAQATETLDLTGVLQLLERWRRVAESSRDARAHRRMLDHADRLSRGDEVSTEAWSVTRHRLGLQTARGEISRVYSVETEVAALDEVAALPAEALPAYAELMTLLEVAPWSGDPYNLQRPDANMRTHTFGGGAHGLAIYLVLEADRRVVILRVLWVG